MSDNARPQPAGDKPGAKAPASAAATGSKSASSARTSSGGEDEESFDFLAPPQNLDELGRLAHYRVLKVLGKGGMGTVFMAEDTKLHRVVALKVMLPAVAKKAIARDRFIREARATAKIEHDHIITIYEVSGEDIPVPYAAMQYLKGMTLDDWLRAGKLLNIPQILRIGKEIAKGLVAAHGQSLIHRDIKPSNIWLDAANKGRVKILDFGLARPTNEETHLTQEGMILGTPAYMSPEQARGWNVDERCDLFSLGCVLYRLCAGKLPFTGKDTMSMLLAIINEEPPPLQKIKEDLPTALTDLIHKLLGKKPEDRPMSAKVVVQAIQDIEREWIANGKTMASRTLTAPVGARDQTLDGATHSEVDPALEESAITELELQSPQPGGTKSAPPHRPWLLAGLGVALAAVLSVCCCVGFMLMTDQGQINISAANDEAKERLGANRLTFLDHHKKPHVVALGTHRLPAGGYQLDAEGLAEGLQVTPNQFSLGRTDTVEIVVRYVPPGPPRPARPTLGVVTSDDAKQLQRNWAAYLRCDAIDTNSLTAKLVLVPPGEFLMGSTDEHLQHLNEVTKKFDRKLPPEKYAERFAAEKPQHRVRITRPFYLGMTEVTFAQFSRFVVASNPPYKTEVELSGRGGTSVEFFKESAAKPEYTWREPGFKQFPENPVCNITWKDAEAFCEWLSKKEKKTYRLPTEAEWEYACRAGKTTHWSFGDDPAAFPAYGYLWHPLFSAKFLKSSPTTHSVGKKEGNFFGLFDMHGNVAEMCSDFWSPSYANRPLDDPRGALAGAKVERVVRGGSFLDLPQLARSAARRSAVPSVASVTLGFRIVCEIPWPAD